MPSGDLAGKFGCTFPHWPTHATHTRPRAERGAHYKLLSFHSLSNTVFIRRTIMRHQIILVSLSQAMELQANYFQNLESAGTKAPVVFWDGSIYTGPPLYPSLYCTLRIRVPFFSCCTPLRLFCFSLFQQCIHKNSLRFETRACGPRNNHIRWDQKVHTSVIRCFLKFSVYRACVPKTAANPIFGLLNKGGGTHKQTTPCFRIFNQQ